MSTLSAVRPSHKTVRGRVWRKVVNAGKPVTAQYIAAELSIAEDRAAQTLSVLARQQWCERSIVGEQYVYGPGPGPAVPTSVASSPATAREHLLEEALRELLAEVLRTPLVSENKRVGQAVKLGVDALAEQ